MKDNSVDIIVDRVATLLDVDEEVVLHILREQFDFIKEEIENKNYRTVHLHYLGKFTVKPSRLKWLMDHGYGENAVKPD